MKTFAKKSFSVVLAMLMALSTLTVGAFSAFAAQLGVGTSVVTEASNTFVPQTSGYYNILLSSAANGKTAYSEFEVSMKDNFGAITSMLAEASSKSVENAYQNPEIAADGGFALNPALIEETIYSPAQDTVKLRAGETYSIDILSSLADGVSATLTIAKSDFDYTYTPVESKIRYVYGYDTTYDYQTGESKRDIANPYTSVRTVYTGYEAAITAYYGTATTVSVPAAINGTPVTDVSLSGTSSALAKRITAVTLQEGLKTIDDAAFSGFYALASVNLPNSLESIGYSAFYDTALSGRITIPANVKFIGAEAFYNTDLASVEFAGGNVETIGTRAFGYKDVLNDATADPTDTTVGKTDGFFVVAPATAMATSYAAQNGFAAYDRANCIAGNHPYAVTTVAATLFAKGSTTSVCPVCGATTKKSIAKKTFKIKSLKSSKKSTIVVKASKQADITGYQIQYSTSKKFTKKTTKKVTVKTKKALNKTIKGLKAGKKYYVRVRAYKKANGKTYFSKYTATKSVKVKK